MADCGKIVLDVYNHPDILNLISKIKPETLRDDLHQELAINLLEQPCDNIAALLAENNLLRYAIKTCWLMATSKTSRFYYKYRKSDLLQAINYLRATLVLPVLPESLAEKASHHLKQKNQNIYEDHEVRIFNKYVELGSCRAVARHYNIPVNHACSIVHKVKTELKCILLQ